MSDNSKISWTTRTWNPTVGCTKVSAGCDHCYAETLVNRFAGSNSGFPNRFDEMHIRDDRTMLKPLSRKWQNDPCMVFVNSLSDVFHRDVPDETVARIFAVMALAPAQTFQLLTKRHGRMRSLLNAPLFRRRIYDQLVSLDYEWICANPMPWPLPNLWLGVSVEDEDAGLLRVPALIETPAAVRWLSMEPLIGPVNLDALVDGGINWIVVGGESGRGARPMRAEWVENIRDVCTTHRVPFHFKQLGTVLAHDMSIPGKGDDPEHWPLWMQMRWRREYPQAVSA